MLYYTVIIELQGAQSRGIMDKEWKLAFLSEWFLHLACWKSVAVIELKACLVKCITKHRFNEVIHKAKYEHWQRVYVFCIVLYGWEKFFWSFLQSHNYKECYKANFIWIFSGHAKKISKVAESVTVELHFKSRWFALTLKLEKRNKRICLLKKKPITELCKCILFLPQMNILIFKISLKIEAKISSNFISIKSVKTLIRSLLVWINKCLNEL